MRRRAELGLTLGLMVALLAGGCSSSPGVRSRSLAKGLLVTLALAATAGAAGAAVVSQNREKSLRDDVEMGLVSGREFADRDAEGKRWNRLGRGSVLVGGLAIVGLVIAWQMGLGDHYQFGPLEPPAPAVPPPRPAAPSSAGPNAR
jgi:hypothetical protein